MIILIIALAVIILIVLLLKSKSSNHFYPKNRHFEKIVLSFRRIVTFQEVLTIPSQAIHNNNGREYTVDLCQITCTCPNFEKRDKFEANSSARYCRHLLRLLNERDAFSNLGKWEKAIIDNGSGAPIHSWIVTLTTAPEVLVADSGSSNEWIDVYAHTKRRGERIANASGDIQRFGWNHLEHRWSYGESPPGSRELTPLMKSVTKRGI
jgi:hypothetical protein